MKRFLIVDDSATIRYVLAKGLRQVVPACTVVEAGTMEDALAAFREHKPDVVFLDMMMDGIARGRQILDLILAERVDQRVVLLTGLDATDANVVAAVSEGAFAYIQKPVRVEELRKVLGDIGAESGDIMRIR